MPTRMVGWERSPGILEERCHDVPHSVVSQTSAPIGLVLGALTFSMIQTPTGGNAQSCTNCVVAAGVPLNLLQEPRLEAAVLQTVPQGSLLVRGAGQETNRLVPVTYGGVSGWVIVDGIYPAPKSIAAYAAASIAPPAPSTTTSSNARATLAPLMLRSAPAMEAEPILVIPLGEVVTLTWRGPRTATSRSTTAGCEAGPTPISWRSRSAPCNEEHEA